MHLCSCVRGDAPKFNPSRARTSDSDAVSTVAKWITLEELGHVAPTQPCMGIGTWGWLSLP